jgi:hypothetical protein
VDGQRTVQSAADKKGRVKECDHKTDRYRYPIAPFFPFDKYSGKTGGAEATQDEYSQQCELHQGAYENILPWAELTVGVRGLPIEPRMSVRIMEREVALTPVLIDKLTDVYTEPFFSSVLSFQP